MIKRGTFLSRPDRLLFVAGALSLLAIVLGGCACLASGIAPAIWARNPAAWLVGAAIAWALSRWRGPYVRFTLPIATAVTLAATLFGTGQLGVHRWVSTGTLSINVAMLLLPAALVAVAARVRETSGAWLPALACLAILVIQPDASQATALGAALIWIAFRTPGDGRIRFLVSLGATLLMAASWPRSDPLQPVPEVEGILRLAYRVTPALAVLEHRTFM